MESLAFSIFISTVMYLDYLCYVRGNDSIFFKDKTKLEKDLRKKQELETEYNIKELIEELRDYE